MVKRRFDWTKIFLIGGIPASLGAIGFIAVNLATYINLPNRVNAAEEKVQSIEDYIKEQRIQNELLGKLVEQQEEIIYSPDRKFYLDKKTGKWVPIKK